MSHRDGDRDDSKTYAVIETSRLRLGFICFGTVMFVVGMLFGEFVLR